jgi:Ca2+-transporting ATPase
VLSIVGLILVNRSFSASLWAALRRPSPVLLIVLALVVVTLSLSLLWPAARELFKFGPLHPDDLALTLGAAVAVLLTLEAIKPLWRKRIQGAR